MRNYVTGLWGWETFLGAHGHGAKACSLEEMFYEDMGALNCIYSYRKVDTISLESASKVDHKVVRPEGETTGNQRLARLGHRAEGGVLSFCYPLQTQAVISWWDLKVEGHGGRSCKNEIIK